MKVNGVVVPATALDAAKAFMARRSRFTVGDVMIVLDEAMQQAGMPAGQIDLVMRTAERLLQQERKAGRIVYMSGKWRTVGEA